MDVLTKKVKVSEQLTAQVQGTPDGRLKVVVGVENDNCEIKNGEVLFMGTYGELQKVRDAINKTPRKLMTEEQRASEVLDWIDQYYDCRVEHVVNGWQLLNNCFDNVVYGPCTIDQLEDFCDGFTESMSTATIMDREYSLIFHGVGGGPTKEKNNE